MTKTLRNIFKKPHVVVVEQPIYKEFCHEVTLHDQATRYMLITNEYNYGFYVTDKYVKNENGSITFTVVACHDLDHTEHSTDFFLGPLYMHSLPQPFEKTLYQFSVEPLATNDPHFKFLGRQEQGSAQ